MANGKKKSKKKLFIFGGIGLLVLILLIVAFIGGNKEEIISVQVEKVVKRTITQTVAATGKINPEFKVVINPEVTGEIVELPVKEGDIVKKGQLLIRIKGDQYQAQKQRLEANLLAAQATLKMREAELTKVELDYNRVKELHSKGLASDSELEAAKSNYLTTKASLEAAEANVLQSKASLRETLEMLYKTTILSPMDGVVTKLNVEVGERVFGAGFSMGTDIMTVSDLSNIEAVVDVDENDVVLVSIGDTARIQVDAFKDQEFIGLVSEIGNSAKTSGLGTQNEVVNFEVKIKLIDPKNSLRPGMSCTADIETETIQNVLSVPIQSVTTREGTQSVDNLTEGQPEEFQQVKEIKKEKIRKVNEIVFLVENGKAKKVNVETGLSDDNYIAILSGLKGGEDVISGSYKAISSELNDGLQVRVEEKNKNFNKK
ncbi:MAG: efflux RND transporter periplasmic adaptor subunit [Ignavibacterium sp.]|jgi:HlyD family secretion protein|nr:MAG: efflux RND transporter periplasmic adaptor subunit [Ignavibacterium sp.]MDD5607185.1 efflux RND transporter periplasmic adaptor subunit [Ignavibacterium sp.]MDX9711940.1 efflux RND transporter periplasmic adaptor subunit [Ignavibacteriaceae bacterium]MEB2354957.1 efflux RND transporter periplasmic adaptor subunit [Ignavibacteriales bacterium]